MRIGLVGYFGWGNFGDELFVETYKEIFEDAELVFFHTPRGLKSNLKELINSVDLIIIGGGDILIPWAKSWLYWNIKFLSKPVLVIGVGVPTWGSSEPNVLADYKRFLNHKNIRFISARDSDSAQFIVDNLTPQIPVHVYPDLTFIRKPRDFKKPKTLKFGVALRAQPTIPESNLESLAKGIRGKNLPVEFIILGTKKTAIEDLSVFKHIETQGISIFQPESPLEAEKRIASYEGLVSMKFHGLVSSYQSRVPFFSLSGANKFKSFMSDTGNQSRQALWTDANMVQVILEFFAMPYSDFSKLEDFREQSKGQLSIIREIAFARNLKS